MNHRSVPRIGRLLCGLASALLLGLLAAPVSAQSDDSTVTFTVGSFTEFVFLSPPTQILIEVNDGGGGGIPPGTYLGSRNWRVRANRNWGCTFTLGFWSGPMPPGSSSGASGVPTTGSGGETFGTATVTVSGVPFPTAPMTRTNTLTVTIAGI